MRNRANRAVLLASAASFVALGAGALGAGALGAGVAQAASAPNVVGQKYSDASTAISGAGMTAVVSTTFGDRNAKDDCLVVNQVSRSASAPENSSGSATSQVLVSLNCDSGVATATKPGFSAASPEGKAAVAAAASASASATPAPAS